VDKQGTVLLFSDWGRDGSTGHSKHKQRSLEDATDSDICITSVVALQLYSEKASRDTDILWQNCSPLVSYCHPIQTQFKKETADKAKEKTSVIERINKLEIGDKFEATK
jgi:hypothetical protein